MRDVAVKPRSLGLGEEALRLLIEEAPDATLVCDAEGRIVYANAMTEAMFGYPRPALQGRFVELLLPERFRETHQQHRRGYGHSPRKRRMEEEGDLQARRADGSEFEAEISLVPLRTRGGLLIGAIVRDVSAARAIEAALRRQARELARSNAELEQFAYVASHDLQEPLRMVASYAELLSRRYGEQLDEDAREFIGYMVDGASRMQDLIKHMLDYARAGNHTEQLEATDCNQAVARARRNLEAAIQQSGATFDIAPLPTVIAHRNQLVQLFQNLFSNAIKFRGEAAPHIQVSSVTTPSAYHFNIQDNGVGIARENQKRIFQLFQRLHGSAIVGGNGIGLAICKKIVERYGGQIGVESEPGQGSRFTFSLPTRRAGDLLAQPRKPDHRP
jgi:PAS domain S-box-containing protein